MNGSSDEDGAARGLDCSNRIEVGGDIHSRGRQFVPHSKFFPASHAFSTEF